MNSTDINLARQNLKEVCSTLTTSITHDSIFKEVKIDDEYSAAICVAPSLINVCTIGFYQNTDCSSRLVLIRKEEGENANKLSNELLDESFKQFVAICD